MSLESDAMPWTLRAGPSIYDADTNEHLLDLDDPLPLEVGDGIIGDSGERWRIVDRWFSLDHHGHFTDGLHVWVRRVDGDESDRPGRAAPHYFSG